MAKKYESEVDMIALGGKKIPLDAVVKAGIVKTAWATASLGSKPTLARAKKILVDEGFRAYKFSDGSFGLASDDFHNSFYFGPKAEDFYDAGQNANIMRHGYPKPAAVEEDEEPEASGFEDVLFTVDQEGFDYAFRNYSDFGEVKDEEFHRLREAYVKAANRLEKYIKRSG